MDTHFLNVEPSPNTSAEDWSSWQWQIKNSLKSAKDYSHYFTLSENERTGFTGNDRLFKVRTTPYYAQLAKSEYGPEDPIRKILMPHSQELIQGRQEQLDPLGERKHNPVPRIIHRYTDRVLFLVTDFCSVYCRYCTRKHFTGKDQALSSKDEYNGAISYIKNHPEIKEVILSGGDPLTLSDTQLESIIQDINAIPHVDLIRIGTRMPVVNPFRITKELVERLKSYHPIYMMVHFNHEREVTIQAKKALELIVDNGFPVLNQMVLLNGVNNSAESVRKLSRKLLKCRVKPYYMFQADPSIGTDHLRTTVDQSLEIQKELWGKLSGLAMPNLSLDIPDGGGKVGLVPDFQISNHKGTRTFKGWDGVIADYIDPDPDSILSPIDC